MEVQKYINGDIEISHHTENVDGEIKQVITLSNTKYGITTDYYRGNDTERAQKSFGGLVELTNKMTKL